METVLEEVARAPVLAIEADRVAGVERTHEIGERCRSSTQQKMEVVRKQSPREDQGCGLMGQVSKPGNQVLTVRVVEKDCLAFDAARDDMMQAAGCIEAWGARHGRTLTRVMLIVK